MNLEILNLRVLLSFQRTAYETNENTQEHTEYTLLKHRYLTVFSDVLTFTYSIAYFLKESREQT